ncbi:MAG: hypothetical protein WBG73_02395 [Coleofasciculaceae cyanobacterium]
MFGFIKKFFSGIFAFLGGLIGGKKAKGEASDTPEIAPKAKAKKSKGYYLELDETGNTKLDVTALKPELAKAAVAVVEKLPEPVKAAAVATAEAATATVATATAKAEAVATPAKVEADATPKKKSKKAKAPAAEAENGKVKIEAQPNPPAETNGKAVEATFAPNYLMPTATSSRRRPGPNMNTFLDMARQAKTPG